MKKIILTLSLLFSVVCFADFEVGSTSEDIRYTESEDFDIFPLTSSNSDLIEGAWTGKSVIIEIEDMNFTYDNKPYMWVTISNTTTGEERSALMYFHDGHDTYELYVFGLAKSVPLEIMIFKYSDQMAFERKMLCKKGGYVMKLKFQLEEGQSTAVELQRETCSDL
jgi:hypothetical protein